MTLTGTYRIPAPVERVFDALTDPLVLQRCIEGAERLVQTGEDRYDVHMKVGIGSIKGSYVGAAWLTDKQPPHAFILHVDGKGAPGFVYGRARIQLNPNEGATEAVCDGEGQVGGLIAAVGSRLVEAVARRLMDRFFQRLEGEIGAKG